jgi:flagellar biosynthesis protein FlhG
MCLVIIAMSDQAEALRQKILNKHQPNVAKTISIISGKGGVGKSNFTLNFAITLSKLGKKVLIFDLDIGMGSIDILMGKSPKYTIAHFFESKINLHHIIEKGPENISFIAGGSGLNHFISISNEIADQFLKELEILTKEYDYILFDMGAGMSETSIKFILSTQDVFVIITPEPTSIMDAYSAVKYLHLQGAPLTYYLVGNRMKNKNEAHLTLNKMVQTMDRFLNEKAEVLGFLFDDPIVSEAVMRQVPFTIYKPKSRVTFHLREIAEKYIQKGEPINLLNKNRSFINKLSRLLFKR